MSSFEPIDFVAQALASADGKNFDDLPTVGTFWFANKLRYRVRARRAIGAHNLWLAYGKYKENVTPKEANTQTNSSD